jgi:tetratricopeptide (TPR) repeat protein
MILSLLVALGATPVILADEVSSSQVAQSQADLQTRINQLIEQLGAPQYATRQRAKAELKQLRLEAFDALNAAQDHDDIEIALSARYLVRSIQVNWWTENDPSEVQELLRDYGGRKEPERRNLMEQLALLGMESSFRPLCRLVRYEASQLLSKRAALLILSLELPPSEQLRQDLARDLLANIGKSRRPAAAWLRAYAELLVAAPEAHQRWTELIAQEQIQLAENPNDTSREVTRDLLKWYADQLSELGRKAESVAMMRKTLDLLNPKERELLEAADWFRMREGWDIVIELADRFPDTFARNPLLQYRRAHAYRKLQQEAKADELAQAALESIDDDPKLHLEVARNLQASGLYEPAEREYRYVIAKAESNPGEAVLSRLNLAEMLHDTGNELGAGTELLALVEKCELDEDTRKLTVDIGRELPALKSRMHYFFAQHHRQTGAPQKERKHLLQGCEADPHDADVLIAMYRFSASDNQWREDTLKKIQGAVEHFRGEIRELTAELDSIRGSDEQAWSNYMLATTYNQIAWLVSNTEGDFDEALRFSHKSLELAPGRSGFLDTLGRCYYAKGDFKNAIKYQSQAVAKEPHSLLIVAQLKLFREALRKQQASDAEENAGETE